MKKFRVRITMAVGMAEDALYHEYTMNAANGQDIFKKITNEEWFIGERVTKVHNRPDLDTHYHDCIQTKHISDICIWEEK